MDLCKIYNYMIKKLFYHIDVKKRFEQELFLYAMKVKRKRFIYERIQKQIYLVQNDTKSKNNC